MKRIYRRYWLWLLAAVLPVILFAYIDERNSWNPRTLHGIPSSTAIAWSPDGRFLISLSSDDVYICDTKSNNSVRVLKTAANSSLDFGNVDFTTVQIAPDGHSILVGCRNSSGNADFQKQEGIYDFDIVTGRLLRHFAGNFSFLATKLRLFTLGYISRPVTTANWNTIKYNNMVYDLKNASVTRQQNLQASTGRFPGGTIWKAQWTRDEKYIAADFSSWTSDETGSQGSSLDILLGLHIFNGKTGKLICQLSTPATTGGFDISPDNKLVAYVTLSSQGESAKSQLHFWKTVNQKTVKTIPLAAGSVNPLFSPDGNTIAVRRLAGNHTLISLLDWQSGLPTRTIQTSMSVISLAFSPDGQTLATCGENGVTLWRLK